MIYFIIIPILFCFYKIFIKYKRIYKIVDKNTIEKYNDI